MMLLTIDSCGTVRCIYDETIDLAWGQSTIIRLCFGCRVRCVD